MREWCADRYDARYYRNSPKQYPQGPDEGLSRVYRGGGWWYLAPIKFRAADRYGYLPGYRGDFLGLHLVRDALSGREGKAITTCSSHVP